MLITMLFDTVRRYLRYRYNLLCFDQLDDRLLLDIGVSRSALCAEAWSRAAAR